MLRAKRLGVVLALGTTVILAGCGGAATAAPSGPGGAASSGQPSATPAARVEPRAG